MYKDSDPKLYFVSNNAKKSQFKIKVVKSEYYDKIISYAIILAKGSRACIIAIPGFG